ncbi:unnamed protein product [Spirodela intermedia]|uniref:Uncharacterized protein n=2 Tax=Spirodela intermedia TaxID=51605 RepID=A0A7I8IA72_SPIIN|nr:unnamed protein product [Spirodela intermedia]CAA6654490.1 unnamed protein product [Spirodela intermedia]CAA7389089.1 unnamed protein product [Spirodela intermedia]
MKCIQMEKTCVWFLSLQNSNCFSFSAEVRLDD